MAAYKHRTGILLLIGGGGAALALLIYDGLSRNESTGSEPRPVAPAASSASPTIPATAPEEAAPSVANDAPDTAREEPTVGSELVLFLEDVSGGALPPRDVRSARNIQAAGDAAADAALFERDTTGPAILSAPPRKADANAHAESTEPREFYPRPASAEALAGLTSAFRIECNFAEGIGFWGSIESLEPGDAYYRGDIIVYHTIDLDAGSARMTASLGVTGSQKGEIDPSHGNAARALLLPHRAHRTSGRDDCLRSTARGHCVPGSVQPTGRSRHLPVPRRMRRVLTSKRPPLPRPGCELGEVVVCDQALPRSRSKCSASLSVCSSP